MFDFWPFRRKRTVERTPLISELEEQKKADAALKISTNALQRTIARGPAVSKTANRQAELREQNGFWQMFEESMRRRSENR